MADCKHERIGAWTNKEMEADELTHTGTACLDCGEVLTKIPVEQVEESEA